jgi:hypothetical protein
LDRPRPQDCGIGAVLTKEDSIEERDVLKSLDEIIGFEKQVDAKCIATSAQMGEGIQQLIDELADKGVGLLQRRSGSTNDAVDLTRSKTNVWASASELMSKSEFLR